MKRLGIVVAVMLAMLVASCTSSTGGWSGDGGAVTKARQTTRAAIVALTDTWDVTMTALGLLAERGGLNQLQINDAIRYGERARLGLKAAAAAVDGGDSVTLDKQIAEVVTAVAQLSALIKEVRHAGINPSDPGDARGAVSGASRGLLADRCGTQCSGREMASYADEAGAHFRVVFSDAQRAFDAGRSGAGAAVHLRALSRDGAGRLTAAERRLADDADVRRRYAAVVGTAGRIERLAPAGQRARSDREEVAAVLHFLDVDNASTMEVLMSKGINPKFITKPPRAQPKKAARNK